MRLKTCFSHHYCVVIPDAEEIEELDISKGGGTTSWNEVAKL